ncbi:MAG: methyltransferase domain-containing protein [Chitinophagales bacterium]|nr:methyltransferase domain-containing protein [Chitinophagales bacterium]
MAFLKTLKNKFFSNIGENNLINREIWLENTLKKIPEGLNILDAGAGEQQYKKFCSHLVYTSQDFCQYDGTGDERGLQMNQFDTSKIDIVSDITNIPVENSSFDAIMCIEVLEHVPDPVKALNELVRILKPNGYLIITAPFCSLTHFSPYHFATGFNRYFYEYHLKEKFNIIELINNGNYYEYIGQELNRIPLVSREYSKRDISKMDKFILGLARNVLSKINQNKNEAGDLLAYGYHFFGRKI